MSNNNNVYFILSYKTDFDENHYPIVIFYDPISDLNELYTLINDINNQIETH